MSYQLINTGTDNGAVSSPQIVKTINHLGPEKKRRTVKKISKKQIINHLNYINFQDESIAINLKHSRFDHSVSLQAKPQPCTGSELSCLWADSSEIGRKLNTYGFENISFRYGNNNLILRPELFNIDKSGISLALSELYYPLIFKKITHHPCKGIKAQLIQNSAVFEGNLTDFSSTSFHVRVALVPPQTSQWINPGASVEITLSNETEILYSGECWIQNQSIADNNIKIIIEPIVRNIQRFKPKKFRSKRVDTSPSPNILFKHPFTKKFYDLNVINLSGLGFSVEEKQTTASLLPGMILPVVEMSFANGFKIRFKAQVIYRKDVDVEEGATKKSFRFGLTILDIISKDHLKLLSYLHHVNDKNVYICNILDIDSLWNFFFESNFIYPEKYKFLQSYKAEIKETYKKLYTQQPDIARHFTYQDGGYIASHLAMIRFYENSWLIHHHASNRMISFRAGLSVLNQIGIFSNDSYNLYSNHMNYLLCYFRPENKFPNRVFGGAARTINDKLKCCVESFAYFHFTEPSITDMDISWKWSLTPTDNDDLDELNVFYAHKSSGLMLKALDLEKISTDQSLYELFRNSGLKRDRHLFSLKSDEQLKAVIIINIADVGLNLSDLTSAVTIMILDQKDLNKDVIQKALSLLSVHLNLTNIPVLIYPNYFAENFSIEKEREYCLWILDTQYGDNYFKYVNRLTRLS